VGRREAWLTSFLMMALGLIVFAATIGLLWAGLATYSPP